jgi:hypothetical protein
MTQPDRTESRERLAQVHPADRFRAMFGEQVEPMPKTCPHCLGRQLVMVNGGTGLLKPCPKCNPPAQRK